MYTPNGALGIITRHSTVYMIHYFCSDKEGFCHEQCFKNDSDADSEATYISQLPSPHFHINAIHWHSSEHYCTS